MSTAAAAGACGDGDGGISGPPVPRMIPGGGIGDGKISGYLNVFVIDDETDAVVSSAAVRVGESAATTACDALTDSTGIASFDPPSCPSLVGPVNVTVSATGYAPSTWIGVNGRNLTVGVRSISAPAFGSATVYGTIAGWDALPAPAVNHQTLAIIGASQLPGLGDRENDMAQGKRTVDVDIGGTLYPVDIDANICARNALVNDCNWRLITRTGAQAHFGIIVDHDTRGTDDDESDDTFTVIAWALKRNLSFGKGATASGEVLDDHPRRRHAEPGGVVCVGAFGLDYVGALPTLELGAEGRIAIILPALDSTSLMTRVPKLTGVLADAHYDLIATARDAIDEPQPVTPRGCATSTSPTTVAVSGWLPPPTGLTVSNGTYSFTPAAGRHVARRRAADGDRRAALVDHDLRRLDVVHAARAVPDPLPLGSIGYAVSALRIPGADLADVAFDDLADRLTDIATDQITYSR